ncbi:MAG TPA: metal-dependent hydrolase [Thermoplasmata archaeon]|jgi:TatD-related deoxyribonuclease|nr:MAG TPA: metal-dependent hydrolase [Thermoplasmata archaeon]
MILFDNHLHLRRDGRFLDAVREFQNAGGTHFILCQYPMPGRVLEERSYKSCYQETLQLAEEIRAAVGIGVFVVVGPYPVDIIPLQEKFGRETAIALMKKGMEDAAVLCKEHKCIALGEIGRPHFPVDQQIITDSNDILIYGMQKAKDAGVPVVLHTESTTTAQCKELAEIGRKVGLKPEKIIKHFAPPLITPDENYGLMPSVLASKKNIVEAIGKGTRFFMETDYIDDPQRPGAVLGPKTVPKLTKNLLALNIMTEQQAYTIHVENPHNIYDITLED